MAGIYIHIPFCRQACHYCDFHFTTNLSKQKEVVSAICKEITDRAFYLKEPIDTIYFGGGTPSLLSQEELKMIVDSVKTIFEISPNVEITLEANPEDLSSLKLEILAIEGVNRLSIGVQTFSDKGLLWMNRNHTTNEAIAAVEASRKAGFNNISLDLIYALPSESHQWITDLEKVVSLDPEHISIYGLTIEPRTVFGKQYERGELVEVEEEVAANQYLLTIEHLSLAGFHQYEVSNFSKPGYESRHNSSYWAGNPYLGVGPGAHSFDGKSRRFNVRNNAKYLTNIQSGNSYSEIEILSEVQKMNEYILTRLRTTIGLDLTYFESRFSVDLSIRKKQQINQFISQNLLKKIEANLSLTSSGFLVADEIALQLFFDE